MKLTNRLLLFVILVVAVVLRFYHYREIPFTHDEFSALFRLNFDNFSALIEQGVKVDGHPAGIQVFLYYWTRLVGMREWLVKLPFTLCGVASVYLLCSIGKTWFNETVGLLSSAYLASLQLPVMYSQIARPYGSGLFFSLLMVFFWTRLVMHPEKHFYKNTALFVLSAALCAYNHHFSLLFAALVGLSGLLLIRKKYLLRYMLAGVAIFVLYIPHLKIFFYQLNTGGVEGWLGKPQYRFLFDFVAYIFHYSWWVFAVVIGIVVFALKYRERQKLQLKWIILSLSWFLLPLIIGFFYSRHVNAVLQFSVLIFSFYTLFFVLFGCIKKQSTKINLLLITAVLLTTIPSLIAGRKHYYLLYNSAYERIITDGQYIKKQFPNSLSIIDSHPKITAYYMNRFHPESGFIFYREAFDHLAALKLFLNKKSLTHHQLYFGALSSVDPNVVPLIREYFPTIEQQNNYFGGTTWLFSAKTDTTAAIASLTFDWPAAAHWISIDSTRITGNTNNRYYALDSLAEWGPAFSIPLSEVMQDQNNFIDISVSAQSAQSLSEVVLVATLDTPTENFYWGGTDFGIYEADNKKSDQWLRYHHSVKLSDIKPGRRPLMLNVYVWNKGKKTFRMDDFTIRLREGNPFIYGIYENF